MRGAPKILAKFLPSLLSSEAQSLLTGSGLLLIRSCTVAWAASQHPLRDVESTREGIKKFRPAAGWKMGLWVMAKTDDGLGGNDTRPPTSG